MIAIYKVPFGISHQGTATHLKGMPYAKNETHEKEKCFCSRSAGKSSTEKIRARGHVFLTEHEKPMANARLPANGQRPGMCSKTLARRLAFG